MSDRTNYRRLGRNRRPRNERPRISRTTGYDFKRQHPPIDDAADAPLVQRQLAELLGDR